MRFNSHTYMYDTSQCECEKPLLQLVSIHAPAWGATGSYDCSGYASSVSIHAPAWGATLVTVSHINGMDWFQFTRPRGARLTLFPKLDYFIGFNSRARVGRDPTTFRPFMSCTKFQLTRPRGARLALKIYLRFAIGFNSRARVGRDAYQQAFLQWLDVSIHAPAWGATTCITLIGLIVLFQFTRPRGARQPYQGLMVINGLPMHFREVID